MQRLYAPDVIEHQGKYYLFFYLHNCPGGVAVSDSPAGPFKPLDPDCYQSADDFDMATTDSGYFADPSAFVDTDGKVYLYWGFERSHMAQLDPKALNCFLPASYVPDPIPKSMQYYEASSVRKIKDTYYYIYANGMGLAYATGKSPTGPFTYGGVIIENGKDGAPPGNIHGSICQLNGQWYVFYHRQSHNTEYSRRACVERISITPDGSIKPVEQTSLGFKESLAPWKDLPADIVCSLKGGNYVTELDKDTRPVIRNLDQASLGYRYFEFGPKPVAKASFQVTLRPGAVKGRLEIHLDSETGPLLGSIALDGKASQKWTRLSTAIKPVSGRHAVYLLFRADKPSDQSLADVLTFGFTKTK